ncbi:hypothetical protein BJ944DRAFT_258339 [Cunninghamella echinulata]|nr:hypothetical protein BJ944DRAFT_258339 [Cunninghamella echinulata]
MTSKSPQSMESIPNQQQQSAGKRRRPPVKMASAPIRRLDDASPSIAPVSSSPSGNVATVNTPALPQQQGNKRPRTGGKTTPAAILEARRRAVAASDSDSSSGSSSSGSSDESGSSSEDDDSGSSGSGSSSDSDDDDVMDLLAENITRGLSEDRSIQPSSQNETSAPNHYRQSPHQQGTSSTPNINRPAAGPTSLRDLLDGGRGQEDEVSSSGSSSEEEF